MANRSYIAAATVALTLTGCAVMEIDVDVYKGPLSNEEGVKIEQYAAMAIGAKPILVQLRDQLNWGNDSNVQGARQGPCYRPGFMVAADNKTNPFWKRINLDQCWETTGKNKIDRLIIKSSAAIRVNNILSLYEDIERIKIRADDTLSAKLAPDNTTDPHIDYLKAGRLPDNLTSYDPRYEYSFTDQIKEAQRTLSAASDAARQAADDIRSIQPVIPTEIKDLSRNKFIELLGGPIVDNTPLAADLKQLNLDTSKTTDAGLLQKAYEYLLVAEEGVRPDPVPLGYLISWANSLPPTHSRPALQWRDSALDWNTLYWELQNSDRAYAHAKIIFGTSDQMSVQRARFSDRIIEMGYAYHSGREALYVLWQDSLDALYDSPLNDSPPAPSLIEFNATTTLPITMSAAYCQLKIEERYDRSAAFLTADIERIFQGSVILEISKLQTSNRTRPDWSVEDLTGAQNDLRAVFNDPVSRHNAIDALLELNWRFQSRKEPLSNDCKVSYGNIDVYGTPTGRQYGLVQVPFNLQTGTQKTGGTSAASTPVENGTQPAGNEVPSESEAVDLLLVTEVEGHLSTPGGGLGRGRLEPGLERLIEKFLDSRTEREYLNATLEKVACTKPECMPDKTHPAFDVERNHDILNGALLRFSEKLLFLANHNILLENNNKKGESTSQQPIKAGQIQDRDGDSESWSTNQTDGRDLALVLQAIGNAIQVLGDELAAKKEYDARSRVAATLEDQTIDLVWGPSCQTAICQRKAGSAEPGKSDTPGTPESKPVDGPYKLDTSVDTPITQAAQDVAKQGTSSKPATAQVEVKKSDNATSTGKSGKSTNTTPSDSQPEIPKVLPMTGKVSTYASGSTDSSSQLEAFDRVITALRHALLKRAAEHGKDHDSVKYLKDALKIAYEQRASMTYIRSAAIYLRSSYAATGLQEGNDILWQNELARHAGSGLPLIGEDIANDLSEGEAEVIGEIDKQFWQTINNVSVRGAGTTNYAIAKDDIGNWYVKGFSSDPKAITKAAFALGTAQLGVGLNGEDLKKALEEDPEPEEDNSAVANKFEADRKKDAESLATANKTLMESVFSNNALSEAITVSWGKRDNSDLREVYGNGETGGDEDVRDILVSGLNDALEEIKGEFEKGGDIEKLPPQEFAARLERLLQLDTVFARQLSLLGYDAVLDKRIGQAQKDLKAAEEQVEAAKQTDDDNQDDVTAGDAKNTADSALEALNTLKGHLSGARAEAKSIVALRTKADIETRLSARLKELSTYHNTLSVLSATVAN